jgi:4-hydroxy-tetrahydrodipicolinate synthase
LRVKASIKGVVAAIVTPITADFRPDPAKLVDLAEQLLANGCDGLNLLGTTGEAASFTVEQRIAVMDSAAKRLPLNRLLVGTGASAVGDAVRLSAKAAELGFGGVLLLPPFYYKGVPDSGVIEYVNAVVEATKKDALPIYLYNFPALSGVPYTEPLVRSLIARFGSRIAGLKDSSGDLPYARSIAALPGGLAVFPSNEGTLLEARSGGFAGCISATVNLNASLCSKAFREGDERALAKAVTIRNLFNGRPLIPGIKCLVAMQRADPQVAAVMPPLSRLGASDEQSLREQYRSIA